MWICTRAELPRLMRVPAQVRDCRRGLAGGESCSSLAEGYPDKEHGVLAQFLGKLREKGLALISWMLEAGFHQFEAWLGQPACKIMAAKPVAAVSSGRSKCTLLRAMQPFMTDPGQVLVFRSSQGGGSRLSSSASEGQEEMLSWAR